MLRKQPELKVVMVPIDELKPYENNAKKHTNEQMDAVEASIREFDFTNPVIAWHDEGGRPVIVAGHARAEAARRQGLDAVPVIFRDDWDDAKRRAYVLVDNQTTMMTGWDDDLLGYELDTFGDTFDFSSFGFDDVIGVEGFGTDFDLPDEDKPNVSQATFILSPEQRDFIMAAIGKADTSETETFGNVNRNGNALYEVVTEWHRQKTSSCE